MFENTILIELIKAHNLWHVWHRGYDLGSFEFNSIFLKTSRWGIIENLLRMQFSFSTGGDWYEQLYLKKIRQFFDKLSAKMEI